MTLPNVPEERPVIDSLYSHEAEENVIGAVLINQDAMAEASFLEPSDFYILRHRWIWQVFKDLRKQGKPIDTINVCDELAMQGRLEAVGGSSYLTAILSRTYSSLNAESHGSIIVGYARRRDVVYAAQKLVRMAFDGERPLDEIRTEFLKMAETQKAAGTGTAIAAEEAALNLMELIVQGDPLGIPSGLPLLDKQIGAMPLGETILLVGDSTVGKTALSLQIAENVSRQGKRALYISTESKAHTMVARRVCGLASIPQKLLRSGKLTDIQSETLQNHIRDYMARHSGTLFFDDVSNHVSAIERSVSQVQPDFIVIDHLGELMTRNENRTLALLEDFDRLKHMAKKHNASQIVIHTISADDAHAKSEDEPPNFNSLGWAKDLKYKNDILLGLYASKDMTNSQDVYKRFLWVMKDREGARYSKINLKFNATEQWYTDTMF